MLKLKKLEEKDLEKVMNWRMKEEVTKYMYTDPVLDIEKQKKWFDEIDYKKDRYWIIQYEGKDIGLISANNIDEKNKRCAWGYYIGEVGYRGKGIARDLECSMYDYVFYRLNLNKLVSEVFEFNEKVVQIHEKFGSKVEGCLKDHILKNGEYYNVITMGVTEREWRKVKHKVDYKKIEF